jgi:hypothetical protein
MVRLPNRTIAGFLDHVEALLLRRGRRSAALPTRGYLADAAGRVTLLDLPPVSGSAEHEALGAILGHHARERSAVMAVLQFPAAAVDGEGTAECVLLVGVGPRCEVMRRHLLVARRQDGRIASLLRPGEKASRRRAPA